MVEDVYKGSPAQKAGFEKGDVLLAINGVEYSKENKPALKEVYSKFEPGSQATTYVVKSARAARSSSPPPSGRCPKEVQAKWINEHMKITTTPITRWLRSDEVRMRAGRDSGPPATFRDACGVLYM